MPGPERSILKIDPAQVEKDHDSELHGARLDDTRHSPLNEKKEAEEG